MLLVDIPLPPPRYSFPPPFLFPGLGPCDLLPRFWLSEFFTKLEWCLERRAATNRR